MTQQYDLFAPASQKLAKGEGSLFAGDAREYVRLVSQELARRYETPPLAYVHSYGCQQNVSDGERYSGLLAEMGTLPEKIQKTLDDKERIQWFASKYANAKDIFFIGRGIDYAISMEGSLKMKEISYIHSEAYAAGELKHGTISLVEDGILVVGVLTQSALFEKTLSNMVEVKSRGAYLMGLTTYGNYNIEDTADFSVYVPPHIWCADFC